MNLPRQSRFAVVLTVLLKDESNPEDIVIEGTSYTATLVAGQLERDRIIEEFKNEIVSIEAGKPVRIWRPTN